MGLMALAGFGIAAMLTQGRGPTPAAAEPASFSSEEDWAEAPAPAVRTAPTGAVFAGCDDARAAGRENIPIGDPAYRADMDGDSDGFACEPYRGR